MDQEEMEVCSGARRSEERGTCGEDVLYERKIYFQLEKRKENCYVHLLYRRTYMFICVVYCLCFFCCCDKNTLVNVI